MASRNHYEAGWVDSSINDFLRDNVELTRGKSSTLITCLDSTPDVASVFRFLEGQKSELFSVPHSVVGPGVLVPTRRLIAANRSRRIFFGFDEIWFVRGKEVVPKPAEFTITRPGPIDPLAIERYSSWMDTSGSYLGLGDGEGMNFCLRVKGFPSLIVRTSSGTIASAC